MAATERKCRKCAGPLPEDAKFCPACGTPVELSCRACGAPMEPDDRFCRVCGTAQRPDESQSTGEHKQITVVFCDVVGSTRLSIEADTEDLRDALQRYQQICAEAVERHDGMIAQYLGDGIVAYFGYPVSNEDAPALAAEAAMLIIKNLGEQRGSFEKDFGTSLDVRIGIHVGRVLVTEMGAGNTRAPNSVTGAVPNIAARIESCAPDNSIAVSQEFRDRLLGRYAFGTLGVHALKGVDTPLEVFQLTGRARARLPMEAADHLSLVGREDELGQLLELWRGVPDRHGPSFATVTGEPGIGKSGLIAQFLSRENACGRGGGADGNDGGPQFSLRKPSALSRPRAWSRHVATDDGRGAHSRLVRAERKQQSGRRRNPDRSAAIQQRR